MPHSQIQRGREIQHGLNTETLLPALALKLLRQPGAQMNRRRKVALRRLFGAGRLPRQVHACDGAVSVRVALNFGAPEPGPVGCLDRIVDRTPRAEPDRKEDLLSEYPEVVEMQ